MKWVPIYGGEGKMSRDVMVEAFAQESKGVKAEVDLSWERPPRERLMTNDNWEGEQLTEGESGSEGEEERESTQRGEKRKKRLGLAKGIFIVYVDCCKDTPHFSTSWFTPTHSRTQSSKLPLEFCRG